MLETISLSTFFVYSLAAVFIYYCIASFIYYNKEIAGLFTREKKQKEPVVGQTKGEINKTTIQPLETYSPIQNVEALPIIVPGQPLVDQDEEVQNVGIVNEEEPTSSEEVSPEDLELLTEIQADELDIDLEEEFLPFDDQDLEVNEGGLSIDDIIETVDMAVESVAVIDAGGQLSEETEDNLVQNVGGIEKNDFWENMLSENTELDDALQDIKKKVFQRHGKDPNNPDDFNLTVINLAPENSKETPDTLSEDKSIEELLQNWKS